MWEILKKKKNHLCLGFTRLWITKKFFAIVKI